MVERHLNRFCEGQDPRNVELIWYEKTEMNGGEGREEEKKKNRVLHISIDSDKEVVSNTVYCVLTICSHCLSLLLFLFRLYHKSSQYLQIHPPLLTKSLCIHSSQGSDVARFDAVRPKRRCYSRYFRDWFGDLGLYRKSSAGANLCVDWRYEVEGRKKTPTKDRERRSKLRELI